MSSVRDGRASGDDREAIEGERVQLRRVAHDDVPRLLQLASAPSVSDWWPVDEAELLDKVEGRGGAVGYTIRVDGQVAGLVQYHEETDPDYRHAGLDIFVGEPFQRGGIGSDAIRTLARYLVRERGHHRLTIDPAALNEAAIRCYSRVGFRPVGIMREYERGLGDSWHDNLLMDLLARELDGGP